MKALNSVKVDKENMRVAIGGGCLWGDVYTTLRDHGLECVGGGVHVVGVGGHLTGGTFQLLGDLHPLYSNHSYYRWLRAVIPEIRHGYT